MRTTRSRLSPATPRARALSTVIEAIEGSYGCFVRHVISAAWIPATAERRIPSTTLDIAIRSHREIGSCLIILLPIT